MSDVGEAIRLRNTFRNADTGLVEDPSSVELILTDPSGNEESHTYDPGTLVRESEGVYHLDFTPDERGRWYGTWSGVGGLSVVEPFSFVIRPEDGVGGSFTYSPANTDDPISMFRLDLGDTDPDDPLFTDEEIQSFIDRAGTGTAALGMAYRSLANRYSRLASFSIGGLKVEMTARAILWGKKADAAEGDTAVMVGPAVLDGTVPLTNQPYFTSDMMDSIYTGKEVPRMSAAE